jgi:hypothetical protein
MHAFHRRLVFAAALAFVGAAVAQAAVATDRHLVIRNVGVFPGDMAVGFRSVWVNDHRGGTVFRISRKNKVRRVEIGESVCSAPAIGGGRVWVWACDSNQTFEVDPVRMKIVGRRKGIGPVYGAGSLWTMDRNGKILRIDPKSGVVLARIDPQTDDEPNGGPDGVSAGSLWVSGDSSVSRIDVKTNKVSAVIPLPGAQPSGDKPGGYLYANFGVFAFGTFWTSNAAGMYAIDPATNRARQLGIKIKPLSQGGDVQVVAGAGSVWVRTSDKTVVRIDPKTGAVSERYPAAAAGGGGGIAVTFGSLWVANGGLSNVWRERVH